LGDDRFVLLTRIDENYKSSGVVFIAWTDLLNPPHPRPEYVIQFALVDSPQNLVEELKKLVLVGHLNLFEFFFHYGKQVEVTGARSGE
jgi:hypothetical protein